MTCYDKRLRKKEKKATKNEFRNLLGIKNIPK